MPFAPNSDFTAATGPARGRAMLLLALGLLPACVPVPPNPGQAPRQPSADDQRMFGMTEKFDRFDVNGDGYLTRAELKGGVYVKGVSLTPAQIDKVMKAYDGNRDGRISQHEAEVGAARGPQIFRELGL